jgi:hypothetical protein
MRILSFRTVEEANKLGHILYSTEKEMVMRVLTAKEVNFVSGGFDPLGTGSTIQDGSSGGYQGTGMPQTSGNSIGDVNYTPPTQAEACANAADLGAVATIAGVGGIIIGVSNPIGWLAGALAVVGAGSFLANDCSSSDSGGSSSGSCPGGG